MRAGRFVVATIVSAAAFFGLGGPLPQAAATNSPVGACCFAHGSCQEGYHSDACSNVGGSYQGDATVCSGVTCQPVPCGESGSPVCGGTCPAGTRCTDTDNLQISIVVVSLVATDEEQGSGSSCACAEVSCGGVPLENGQGCCAGTPFTIGVQGCCNGEIVPVDSECFCEDFGQVQEQQNGLPVDLRETGCCGLGSIFRATASTEEGIVPDSIFNVVQEGCCERDFFDDDVLNGPLAVSSRSNYTFGTGVDCCPGRPIVSPSDLQLVSVQEILDVAGLCVGACSGSECAVQDCCRCESCLSEFEDSCVAAGSPTACESLCATAGCDAVTYVANAMCGEDGSCIPSATAAPAASSTGLLVLLAALLGVGGLALLGRSRMS